MAVYKAPKNRALVRISDADKINNQITLYGTNPSYSVSDGIFFLEYLEIESGGTATLADGAGTTMASGMTGFSNDRSPLRCDEGITITGSVAMAKGFFVQGCYA